MSISCFLIFYKRVFIQSDNIPPQKKDPEVVSVLKMCLTCLKYFAINSSGSSEFNFVF